MGQAEEGLDAVSEALRLVNKISERFWKAELYLLKSNCCQRAREVNP